MRASNSAISNSAISNSATSNNAIWRNARLRELLSHGHLWNGKERTEERGTSNSPPPDSPNKCTASFGVGEIDDYINGGLPLGFSHELALDNGLTNKNRNRWQPPLFIIANLLRSLLIQQDSDLSTLVSSTVWIGRQCWPTPTVLETSIPQSFSQTKQQQIKDSHIFIDPPDHKRKLWSIIEALQYPNITIVIADSTKLSSIALRRIQLAAQKGKTLCLLMCPPWELSRASSAYSRWLIRSIPTVRKHPAWEIELLRFRGITIPRSWSIELYEENTIRLLPDAIYRKDQTQKTISCQCKTEVSRTIDRYRTA